MEMWAFLFAGGVFSAIRRTLKGEGFIADVLGALFEGSIDDFFEEVVKKFAPRFRGYIAYKSENQKTMLKEIVEYVESLPEERKLELSSFFEKHPPSIPEELICNSTDFDSKENAKKIRKVLKTQLEKEFGKIDKIIDSDVHFKSSEDMSREIFKDASHIPSDVIVIIQIINRHIFEIKYRGIGAEERDVLKVVQYMIEDSPKLGSIDGMLKRMEDYMHIILQQNSNPDFSVAKIESLAKKDPFFFVRLQCPECASTEIRREGDRAECLSCGESFELIKNNEELLDVIERSEEEIKKQIRVSGKEITDELSRDISDLASRMVSIEYFDRVMAERARQADELGSAVALLNANTNEKMSEIFDSANARITEMFKTLEASQAGIAVTIRKEADKLDVMSKLIYGQLIRIEDSIDDQANRTENAIGELKRALETYQNDLLKKYDNSETVNEIIKSVLNDVKVGNSKLIDILGPRLDEIYKLLEQTKKLVDKIAEDHNDLGNKIENVFCPHCQREGVTFELIKGTKTYKCNDCGYTVEFVENINDTPRYDLDACDFVIECSSDALYFDINYPSRRKADMDKKENFIKKRREQGMIPRILVKGDAIEKLGQASCEISPEAYMGEYMNLISECGTVIITIDHTGHSFNKNHIVNISAAFSGLKTIFLSSKISYSSHKGDPDSWKTCGNNKFSRR